MAIVEAPALGQTAKTAEGAAELYDAWAKDYDDALKSWGYPVPERVAETLVELKVSTTGVLIDLGCGTGMSGEAIRAKGFTGSLTGLDISKVSLEQIKLNKPNIYTNLEVANLDLPLPLNKTTPIDAFVSCGVFSYVENFEVLFGEIISRLRTNGYLIFSHHVAYWDDDRRGNRSFAEKLIASGQWTLERVGEPEDYMPLNPEPLESAKRIRIIVLKKL